MEVLITKDKTKIEPSVLTQDLLNDFGLILYEISNCRRQIAVFLAVGGFAKENHDIEIDNLCGWTQDALLRLIVIDSFKILDGAKKIIRDIISETKFHGIIINLFKAAEFDSKNKALSKIISPWKTHRNKRYAHMEKEMLPKQSLELIPLAGALKNLKNSINFIMHYLSNPRYISIMHDKEVAPYSMENLDESESSFSEQMKHDRIINKVNQLLKNTSLSEIDGIEI